MRVLVVEDEPVFASKLGGTLVEDGFVVDAVDEVGDALAAIDAFPYDAIMLDRDLPDGDGLTLLPDIRKRGRTAPVIILTASRQKVSDRIAGLESGADDYILKPAAMGEIVARLRCVLRRPKAMEENIVTVGTLSFDLARRQASTGSRPLALPRRETDLLECLVRARGRVVSRRRIEESLYGFNEEVSVNAVDVAMHRLRSAILKAECGATLTTLRGIGYVLSETADPG